MNAKTTSSLILSTAMFGTVLAMPLNDSHVEASTKPISSKKNFK
ncbi:hypothetical protein [Halalkalibacter alkalisediminis]|uniref:Uncharacterized protein n=1 Tax=Halalkalibacter alkalisediminis TaxID=935616 RepID=A0ABV6NH05_9BACI|nr:hypothetical protein [Halalkalibacter alkalisediminis]